MIPPVGGGYAIANGGGVIGAIGISGGKLDQDERATLAAINEVGLAPTDDLRSAEV